MWLNPLSKPGPRDGIPVARGAFPLVGHLPALIPSLRAFVRAQEEANGPVFWINRGFGDRSIMITGEPALEILRNKQTASRDAAEITEPVVGGSLIVADGALHRRARGAAARTFTPKGLALASAGETMRDAIQRRVDSWGDLTSLPIVREGRELALDIIFRIIGVAESETARWRENFDDLLLGFINLPLEFVGTPRWRSKRARRWLDAEIEKLVERAGREDDGGLLASLARGRDEGGKGLSPRELIDNARVLLFAGHETTASAIAWMVFHLAEDPALWRRLCEEVGPDAEAPVDAAGVKAFPYSLGLFREVLRLHPPVGLIARVVTEPLTVHGHALPVGTSVSLCVGEFGVDPARFEEPERVIPARWADKPVRPGSVDTLAFGAGPHFCLGYHLACWEAVQFIVTFAAALQRWGKRLDARALPRTVEFPIARPATRHRVRLVSA